MLMRSSLLLLVLWIGIGATTWFGCSRSSNRQNAKPKKLMSLEEREIRKAAQQAWGDPEAEFVRLDGLTPAWVRENITPEMIQQVLEIEEEVILQPKFGSNTSLEYEWTRDHNKQRVSIWFSTVDTDMKSFATSLNMNEQQVRKGLLIRRYFEEFRIPAYSSFRPKNLSILAPGNTFNVRYPGGSQFYRDKEWEIGHLILKTYFEQKEQAGQGDDGPGQ